MIWINPEPPNINRTISSAFDTSIVLSRELAKKGLRTTAACKAHLDPGAYQQTSPFSFPDMRLTVRRIIDAINNGETIGIWGDFDVDGQTSTSILLEGLTQMGAKVIFHIPIRATESHGIQIDAFKSFLKLGPTLILTCDTGISDHASIEYAQSIGVDVIITDHHTLPESLPHAHAIINPHQLPANHPLSYLAGVGAAFQVIRALNITGKFGFNVEGLYDLVALGTIADLAVLKSENRFYAQMGLKQMNQNLRPALKSLLAVSKNNNSLITENTIGFNMAPRLNAAGRLSDANENVKFLLSSDKEYCVDFAKGLEQLNHMRKLSVNAVLQSAQDMIKQDPSLITSNEFAIILQRKGWERGVLGLAAGNLAELYKRPVILLNIDGKKASGSARSIVGIDITAAIRENEEYLIRYGGHPMAAGLSIPTEKLADFSFNLKKSVRNQASKIPSDKTIHIDHFISFSNIGNRILNELAQLAPFGQGNPPPVFASRNLEIIKIKPFGSDKKHIQITLRDRDGNTQQVTKWNSEFQSIPLDRVDIAYHIQPDEYRGKNTVFLEYINHRESIPNSTQLDALTFQVEFEDHRHDPDELRSLDKIINRSDNIQIWFEGLKKPRSIETKDRSQLQKKEELIILTAPPSYKTLNELLETAQPKKVYFFGLRLNPDEMNSFLTNLGGLIKHCLNNKITSISLNSFAAQLCHTEEIIVLGLSWFNANGNISTSYDLRGNVNINIASNPPKTKLSIIEQKINNSLKETSAFRSYYLRVDPENLLIIDNER
jgi:single-stranded-DNA-specific exonuclease